MIAFLLGIYAAGLIIGLVLMTCLVMLGGDSKEVWKIPAYSIGWPIVLVIGLLNRGDNTRKRM
jgi:hypothetical protein